MNSMTIDRIDLVLRESMLENVLFYRIPNDFF